MESFASAPKIYLITCTTNDTEYSQLLPNGTKHFELQARESASVRVSFDTGDVASGTDYFTIKADDAYSSYALWGSATTTIYFAHTFGATVNIELICWI